MKSTDSTSDSADDSLLATHEEAIATAKKFLHEAEIACQRLRLFKGDASIRHAFVGAMENLRQQLQPLMAMALDDGDSAMQFMSRTTPIETAPAAKPNATAAERAAFEFMTR